uniref:NADH-ubiquinone oxidoreductase chain 3 n=1 Tax=Thelepus plagiostoma TaxID=1084972 RepID=A0A8B6QMG0_9ANNE|nr:NADH dehydrogenase subunit 3 [Thelepus plagiostoma]QTJ29903.1 NADH dehydrogenase subunit 3 [Thelepus plagiostoma]
MMIWLFILGLSILITFIVMLLAWILNHRHNSLREKLSPFECGFDPKNSARIPFSLRFFLLAVIFLVFDIEIALLTPLPIMFSNGAPFSLLISATLFFVILILGLLHEWREGSLNWTH